MASPKAETRLFRSGSNLDQPLQLNRIRQAASLGSAFVFACLAARSRYANQPSRP
jgi:hypothetical protein